MSDSTDRQILAPMVCSDTILLSYLPFPALIFDITSLTVLESNAYFCNEGDIPLNRLLAKYNFNLFSTEEIQKIAGLLNTEFQYSTHKLTDNNNEISTFEIKFNLFPDNKRVFLLLKQLSAHHIDESHVEADRETMRLGDLDFPLPRNVKMLEDFPFGIYRTTAQGKFLFANKALANMLGYNSVNDLYSLSVYDVFVDSEDRIRQLSKWEHSVINIDEVRLKSRLGNTVWVKDIGKAYFNSKGEIEFFEGLVQDISSAKSAEQMISSQSQFLSELVNNVYEGVGVIDADYNLTFCNTAFAKFLSLKPDEICGHKLPEIFGENKAEAIAELEINRYGFETSFEMKGFSDSEKTFLFKAIPRFDASNNYKGSFITLLDITDRTISEKELHIAREKAQEADRLKSSFLTNMSHEIRTPMNSILGFSNMLKRPGISKGKRDQYLDIIIDKGKHLMSVISDIIDITRIEENQIQLSNGPCNINELMEELFEVFSNELAKQNKDVKLTLNSSYRHSYHCIVTDSIRLVQVLSNLLNNSLKFTDTGTIEFGFKAMENSKLLFYVRDTGIGVLPELHLTIFERFRQADESFTRIFGGTGLGLAICKGLVNLMGGEIWVESDGKSGSTFNFTIPLVIDEPDFEPKHDLSLNTHQWHHKNILIIEDDQASFQLLNEYLETTQCNVTHAGNGQEALALLKGAANIDLILLDIQLPVMDGYQIAKAVRKFNKTIPIIAQTAHAMSTERAKCIEAGCDDYLSKPIQFDLLEKILVEYLD